MATSAKQTTTGRKEHTYFAFQPDVGLFIWKREWNPHLPGLSPGEVQIYLTVFKKKSQDRRRGMHCLEEFTILQTVEARQEAEVGVQFRRDRESHYLSLEEL